MNGTLTIPIDTEADSRRFVYHPDATVLVWSRRRRRGPALESEGVQALGKASSDFTAAFSYVTQLVLRAVTENPGLTPLAVARRVGVPLPRAVEALDQLLRARVIAHRR